MPALLASKPAKADYGEGANVFGKITNKSGALVALVSALPSAPVTAGAD